MTFLVATNVVASRPPERRPTGTPLAHVKIRERGANLPTLFLSISHGQMAHPMGLKIFFFSYLSGIPPIWPLQGGTSQLITTHDSLWPPLFIIESFFIIKTRQLSDYFPRGANFHIGCFLTRNGLIVDINIDMWALTGENCQKLVVVPKMSTIISKIVRKHCLHACNFFHVYLTKN